MTKPVRKAIFPVAGLGTRFLPATKAMPKEMLPVVDKPLIQYAVEEAREAGIEEFIFVTGRGKNAIEDHFDFSYELDRVLTDRGRAKDLETARSMMMAPGQLTYLRQQEPLGLGHAVWCARHLVEDEPFAVLLADDLVLSKTPCLAQMCAAYQGGHLIAAMDVPRDHVSRYGVLDIAKDDGRLVSVKGMVEKPAPKDAPSTLCVIGRYILDPGVFAILSEKQQGAGGEIQLTDALARMIGKVPFHGYRFEGTRFDCGDKVGFFEANVAFALARPDLGASVRGVLETYAARAKGAPSAR
ncbi:MAG: UTP--glucose-1-phosphate uridylyltransferase GalU [Alphaproteobacteria bacterium]